MRQLTTREHRLATDILAGRKPLYIDQRTVVRFVDGGRLKIKHNTKLGHKVCDNQLVVYEIEFVAVRSNAGLIWQPSREISGGNLSRGMRKALESCE